MADYYEKRRIKVALAEALMAFDWQVYGYKPDESDISTDHISPASWTGIASKNGYVLVVDLNEKDVVYYSGKSDNSLGKAWPIFQANPGRSVWHLEKDGVIIERGTSLWSWGDVNVRTLTSQYMLALAKKLEYLMEGNQTIGKERKLITFKDIRPVEVTEPRELKVGQLVLFKSPSHTGYYFVDYIGDKFLKFIKSSRKWSGPLKPLPHNLIGISKQTFDYYLSLKKVQIVDLKEVEIQEEREVYTRTRSEA